MCRRSLLIPERIQRHRERPMRRARPTRDPSDLGAALIAYASSGAAPMPPQIVVGSLKRGLSGANPDQRTQISIGIQDRVAKICRERTDLAPYTALQLIAAIGVLVSCDLCSPSKAEADLESLHALMDTSLYVADADCYTQLSDIDENLVALQFAWEGLDSAQKVFTLSRASMSEAVYQLVSGLTLAELADVVADLVEFSRVTILDQHVISRCIRTVTERELGQLQRFGNLEWQEVLSTIRCFGVVCQNEPSCSGMVAPQLMPWIVGALKRAPLLELPKALRRIAAAFAPWPIALESASIALQEWVPSMLCEVMGRPWNQARGLPEWIVDIVKAAMNVQAVKEGELRGVCNAMVEKLDEHGVWIAGVLIAKPSDRDERVKIIQQWLFDKLKRCPSRLYYMPGRAFLYYMSKEEWQMEQMARARR